MLAYRLAIGLLVLALISVIIFAKSIMFPAIVGLLFLFSIVVFLGAYYIQSGFFVKAFCKQQTNQKVVAITFDDGPDIKTPEILKLLYNYGAKATFFCIGQKIADNKGVVDQIKIAGHEIGNHSLKHRNFFPVQFVKSIENEIIETNALISSITGKTVKWFRPPFGVTNPRIARAVRKTGMLVAGWSIRSLDTVSQPKEQILQRIIRQIKEGEIILLHDTSNDVVWILEQLLKYLQEEKYITLTVTELAELNKQ